MRRFFRPFVEWFGILIFSTAWLLWWVTVGWWKK